MKSVGELKERKPLTSDLDLIAGLPCSLNHILALNFLKWQDILSSYRSLSIT